MANAERKASLSLDPVMSSTENIEKVKSDKKTKSSAEMEISLSQSKALVVIEPKADPNLEENLEMDLLFKDPDDMFSELTPSDDLKEETSEGINAILSVFGPTALKNM